MGRLGGAAIVVGLYAGLVWVQNNGPDNGPGPGGELQVLGFVV